MISTILIILAAICNAVMDKLDFHYGRSIFKDLNPQYWNMRGESWKNKWKNGDPKQGERFFLSSTVLVFLTDAFHLFKTLQLTFFQLAIISVFFFGLPVFHENMWLLILINFAIYKIIYGVIFTLFFNYIFNKE